MPVALDDVATSLGRSLTDTEASQVSQWIDDAELLIRVRLGDLDSLDQDVLGYVVREAVLDRLRNPDSGLDEEVETIDDYSHTKRYSATKRVRIWPEWWELLSPAAKANAFSIRPAAPRRCH